MWSILWAGCPKRRINLSKLTENELKVVSILKNYEYLDIDNIARQTELHANTLSLILLELEFKNILRALPGKIFSLVKY